MQELFLQIKNINSIVWGIPMLSLLLGTHLFFTFRSKFIQKKLFKAIKLSVTSDDNGEGNMSSFASLTTTLAATLGTGNIIGVSTAVAFGGPGAIFWCWITGVLGMATSYVECYLGVKYRVKDKDGTYLGGPMYSIENGLHSKSLAVLFAVCTMLASFGVGCTTQSNSISTTAYSMWGLSPYLIGFITAIVCGLVIVGGVKTIGNVCIKLVPAMGAFYLIGCFIILILNIQYLFDAIKLITTSAFLPRAMAGGFTGSTIKIAARYGVARGLFTNEAGLGSAAITAASAKTSDPKKQALVSMTATFWDTVVMCAITGLVIVTNMLKNPNSITGFNSSEYTTAAFLSIPYIGDHILSIALIAFAIATLIGWSYFGENAIRYLFGIKSIKLYQILYIVMIFIGAIMSLDFVWELSDFINVFMAVPNLICIILLSKHIKY
ncbi:alanine/glycine:cation symporter family protein [Anaeromicropila herbilytica]|uniref:Transporter n=1 Tax=Anaeromicropila herbilytica TaxID=2785025 RepID=A0A7R7EJ37_9FIRM|nr:sodium:alanine symporter family protein [Anaeromicropila herbilytica]BCN29679.1 transporter [Anaeromicropila herbilytica]